MSNDAWSRGFDLANLLDRHPIDDSDLDEAPATAPKLAGRSAGAWIVIFITDWVEVTLYQTF